MDVEDKTNGGSKQIRRLDDTVINRIAAGEIIHRPASALKEMLENALDAGSTSIKITVREGGLKLLQIQDNGCGIRKADLPIVCERFTTSKLNTFSDLSSLQTYGFRGEALASISHVAHLSVVTKTKTDACAWKAYYMDGVLAPPKPGQSAEPKPCAGNEGTLITVEDMFYNTPVRLGALKSATDEYKRVLDVTQQYAVHNSEVSFLCKKAGQAQADVSTPGSSTIPQAISLLYSGAVSKELLHVTVSSSHAGTTGKGKGKQADEAWGAEAYASSVNYQSKRFTFLLFINHRLVDSQRIKRAIESVYSAILPKGASPFVYLSITIDPKNLDVNVHPTKKEVHFLNEDEITEEIATAIQRKISEESTSRTYEYQTVLTGGALEKLAESRRPSKRRRLEEDTEEDADIPSTAPKKVYPQHKVRTSASDRTLDSMFPKVNPSQIQDVVPDSAPAKGQEIKQSICRLGSVSKLRVRVTKEKHELLSEIIENHTFVGIADLRRCLSLIQHSTKLYLVDHGTLSEEFFYQLGLRQFGNYHRLRLEPPPSIQTLVKLAVEAEPDFPYAMMSVDQAVQTIVDILVSRTEMLEEYFALKIDSHGCLVTLPLLLRNYTPNLDKLPLFLMRLGPQVDWTSEEECFGTFLRELAFFYVPGPSVAQSQATGLDQDQDTIDSERWQIQHVLFPAMRKYLVTPKRLLERDVVQVANLPDLYRVFERC